MTATDQRSTRAERLEQRRRSRVNHFVAIVIGFVAIILIGFCLGYLQGKSDSRQDDYPLARKKICQVEPSVCPLIPIQPQPSTRP